MVRPRRAAALAAAICWRRAADEVFPGLDATRFDPLEAAFVSAVAGLFASESSAFSPLIGRGFGCVSALVFFRTAESVGISMVATSAGFTNDVELRGDAAGVLLPLCAIREEVALTLRTLALFESKPLPLADFLDDRLASTDGFFAGEGALPMAFGMVPSLVPGRLPLLSVRLERELGRGGGPMGLSALLKKLGLRRSWGVNGRVCRLSMVLSERDGLDPFRLEISLSFDASTGFSGRSPLKLCWDAEREPSKELSRAPVSASSLLTEGSALEGTR